MRQLYLAVALPKITYGIDIWYSPPTKPVGYTKNIGSVNALRRLQTTQRIASLAITGSLRTAPTDLLDVHAGILPMELALLKACHNATVRMLTLPNTHPLQKIVEHAKRNPPSKHPSPIDYLLKTLNLTDSDLETIHPKIRSENTPDRFSIEIAETREVSINSERTDNADYRIYSDGSGHSDGIGAAALLYKKGRATPLKSLHAYLGSPEKHNTYEAEITGAILATWILANSPETIGKTVSLYIDNQALVIATNGTKITSGQHLIKALRTNLNTLRCKLKIKWISSHSEVKGNEEADKLAKKAAEGRSSRAADLPHICRRPIATSASAVKQHFNTTLKRRWATSWNYSPRKPRIERIDKEFPYKEFLKRSYMLTRKQTSIIMQLRSEHFPLNAFLHKIGRTGSDTCMECYETQYEGPITETINHFLFECSAHTEFRNELIQKIGRSRFNLRDIMTNTDHMKALVTFTNRSGRFKD
jgi:ribonuclease HI